MTFAKYHASIDIWGIMSEAPRWATSMASSKEDTPEVALRRAFDQYADALFRHAFFRVSDRDRANDLTQETFLRAWDFLSKGGEVQHWKSFLYRILHNLIIDEYRRHKEESLDALLEHNPEGLSGQTAVGSRSEKEAQLDTELLIEQVRAFIPKLPEPQRVALSLRYVDGFSPKEIATFLGVSENVASVRIHRGLAKLKEWCGSLDSV